MKKEKFDYNQQEKKNKIYEFSEEMERYIPV